MDHVLTSLVRQVYSPVYKRDHRVSIEQWLNTDNIRYYSLARYALESALRMLKVSSSDVVALPEFICRDLISSVYQVGAKVKFYPVDQYLNLVCSLEDFPHSNVIVAVNYFGFPQDLTVFNDIADKMGAVLIEDNAHGLLSSDSSGIPLGTRTRIGIFSLRKTFPLLNGAALVVNDSELAKLLPEQLPASVRGESIGFRFKKTLRALVPILGIKPCRILTNLVRVMRKLRTGQLIPLPEKNAEKIIPGNPRPCKFINKFLSCVDVPAEITRRRRLYLQLEKMILGYGGVPVFDSLPDKASPYVFPFRVDDENIETIMKYLKKNNLDCYLWPDLPDSIVQKTNSYYRNVWMIPFLW